MFRENADKWVVEIDAVINVNDRENLKSSTGINAFNPEETHCSFDAEDCIVHLVHQDHIDENARVNGMHLMYGFNTHCIRLLSFEKFLPQWMSRKFTSEIVAQFSVHVQKHLADGKFSFTIMAWGHQSSKRCLLAICYASYFSDEYEHEPTRKRAYIEKTESVGLPLLKSYLGEAKKSDPPVSVTIAMKAAFAEYMSICGVKVHLWAYPAAVEEDAEDILDLALPGSNKNRSKNVQMKTQTDLLDGYKRGYDSFGISHHPFQLEFTPPALTAIPHFVTAGDLDIKQAKFIGAAGTEITNIQKTLIDTVAELKRQQDIANRILREGTLVLETQYNVCRKDVPYIQSYADLRMYAPLTDKDSLLEFLQTLRFDGLDNVLESSKAIEKYLEKLSIKIE